MSLVQCADCLLQLLTLSQVASHQIGGREIQEEQQHGDSKGLTQGGPVYVSDLFAFSEKRMCIGRGSAHEEPGHRQLSEIGDDG